MMDIIALDIPAVKLLKTRRFGDERGWFAETWRADTMAAAGLPAFVQDNQSFSAFSGTVRGLHFQRPPQAQAKLVRVVAGRIFDVVVDLRASSPHFGHHISIELDSLSGDQLFVPEGFAHGFCTLEPATTVVYRVNAYYSREHDAGLLWSDPALAIAWPVAPAGATLSDKDQVAPRLSELGPIFP
jgi:dTDP-4-dehydrorhamnose 3,5-epimerase